jgi:hypothetical protein
LTALPAVAGARVHRLTALTTNDVRVLRALVAGSLTVDGREWSEFPESRAAVETA